MARTELVNDSNKQGDKGQEFVFVIEINSIPIVTQQLLDVLHQQMEYMSNLLLWYKTELIIDNCVYEATSVTVLTTIVSMESLTINLEVSKNICILLDQHLK
jgi:hypothetical protein